MAFLVENAFGGAELVQDANNHPEIRFFTTRKLTALSPLQELGQLTNAGEWTRGVELPWSISSNISISDDHRTEDDSMVDVNNDNWLYMSAVCYLFGKQMQAARNVPVGLINTNWGGTVIQDWCPTAALAECGHALSNPMPEVSTQLYNAMISPLMNHTIKGVIWYQGESNNRDPLGYKCLLPALVKYWRQGWSVGSLTDPLFPFGVVQLAGDVGNDSLALPKFRFTGQTQDVGYLPNERIQHSFLVPAHDLGDSASPHGSVHCRYKKEVGERLALGALKLAYGEDVHAGPVFESAHGNETHVKINFRDTGAGGLALYPMNISTKFNQANWPGTSPFEICIPNSSSVDTCGPMGGFSDWSVSPSTSLTSSGDTIILSGFTSAPLAVRFAWRGYPCEHLGCGLYSKVEVLPPPPFHAWLNCSNVDRMVVI